MPTGARLDFGEHHYEIIEAVERLIKVALAEVGHAGPGLQLEPQAYISRSGKPIQKQKKGHNLAVFQIWNRIQGSAGSGSGIRIRIQIQGLK